MFSLVKGYEEVDFLTGPGRAGGVGSFTFNGKGGKEVSVCAGENGTWTFQYQTGPKGLKAGGGIALAGPYLDFKFGNRPQSLYPERLDYVTASTTGSSRLEIKVNSLDPSHHRSIAVVLVHDTPLSPGEELSLHIGDQRGGGPGSFAPCYTLTGLQYYLYADETGDGLFQEIANSPFLLQVIARDEIHRYSVILPSMVKKKEEMTLHLAAFDGYGNLSPNASALLQIDSLKTSSPREFILTPLDGGRVRLSNFSHPGEGIARFQVIDKRREKRGVSNPSLFHDSPYSLYWGDLHGHGYDGTIWTKLTPSTSPFYLYRYAKEVSALDFASIAIHVYGKWGYDGLEDGWRRALLAAQKFNQEGRFLTFPSLEIHGFGGDRNILFQDIGEDFLPGEFIYSSSEFPLTSEEHLLALYHRCSQLGALVIPHVGGGTADHRFHDQGIGPVIEIASQHGNFEWFGQKALQLGLKVGFIASSDDHSFALGHSRRPKYTGGRTRDMNRRDASYSGASLMAVYAKELTREALFDAIKKRRVYGTTGARMIIQFYLNDFMMGEEGKGIDPPKIKVVVCGTDTLERIDLIRNDRLIFSLKEIGNIDTTLYFTDTQCPKGENYYYVRVTQRDGELGWSSPIWFHREVGSLGRGHEPLWNIDDEEVKIEIQEDLAKEYQERLMTFLSREEDPHRFSQLRPIREVKSPMGVYALFHAIDTKHNYKVHLKLFRDYPPDRIRIDRGWHDFGQFNGREFGQFR